MSQNIQIGHYGNDCKSASLCRKCNKRHNTLLHIYNSEDNVQIKHENSSENEIVVNHAIQNNKHFHVLLPTAIVNAYDKYGNIHQARVLLDSGSQTNFITKDLFSKLQLPSKRE